MDICSGLMFYLSHSIRGNQIDKTQIFQILVAYIWIVSVVNYANNHYTKEASFRKNILYWKSITMYVSSPLIANRTVNQAFWVTSLSEILKCQTARSRDFRWSNDDSMSNYITTQGRWNILISYFYFGYYCVSHARL